MSSPVVQFAGRTLVSTNEGGYRYTPDIPAEDVTFGKPARGNRLWVKKHGRSGAQHVVYLRYDVVSYTAIKSRLLDVADGRIGTLVMPGESIQRCVMGKPSFSEIVKSATGYTFTATITFQEL